MTKKPAKQRACFLRANKLCSRLRTECLSSNVFVRNGTVQGTLQNKWDMAFAQKPQILQSVNGHSCVEWLDVSACRMITCHCRTETSRLLLDILPN